MTDPMSERELAEIRARAEKATKGPWRAFVLNGVRAVMQGDDEVIKWTGFDGSDFQTGNARNCRFIAHARTDIPALLAEIDRLRELMKEAATLIDAFMVHGDDTPCCEGNRTGPDQHSPGCVVTRLRTAREG